MTRIKSPNPTSSKLQDSQIAKSESPNPTSSKSQNSPIMKNESVNPTLCELLEEFKTLRKKSKTLPEEFNLEQGTIDDYTSRVNANMLALFGPNTAVEDITNEHLDTFVKSMGNNSQLANACLTALRKIFDFGIFIGVLEKNIVKKYKISEESTGTLSIAEPATRISAESENFVSIVINADRTIASVRPINYIINDTNNVDVGNVISMHVAPPIKNNKQGVSDIAQSHIDGEKIKKMKNIGKKVEKIIKTNNIPIIEDDEGRKTVINFDAVKIMNPLRVPRQLATLRNYDYAGTGPERVMIDLKVHYYLDSLVEWIYEQRNRGR